MNGTNERPQQEWYWCDRCRDYFYGSTSYLHRGTRCYAEPPVASFPERPNND